MGATVRPLVCLWGRYSAQLQMNDHGNLVTGDHSQICGWRRSVNSFAEDPRKGESRASKARANSRNPSDKYRTMDIVTKKCKLCYPQTLHHPGISHVKFREFLLVSTEDNLQVAPELYGHVAMNSSKRINCTQKKLLLLHPLLKNLRDYDSFLLSTVPKHISMTRAIVFKQLVQSFNTNKAIENNKGRYAIKWQGAWAEESLACKNQHQ